MTPGTFIRPVGKYSYCYEVLSVWPPSDVQPRGSYGLKRWGMKDGQPYNDGRGPGTGYSLSGLVEVRPGIWRDPWEFDTPRWSCCPLYYRRIDVGGQQELFA